MNQCIYRGTTPRITLNIKGVDLSDTSIWQYAIKFSLAVCDNLLRQ